MRRRNNLPMMFLVKMRCSKILLNKISKQNPKPMLM